MISTKNIRKAFPLALLNIIVSIVCVYSQAILQVYDQKTGSPINGAAITLQDGNRVYVTGLDGVAKIDEKPPFSGYISYLGYKRRIFSFSLGENQVTTYLEPEEKMLDEVVVIGYEDNQKLIDIPGAVHRLSPEDIRRFDQMSLVRSLNVLPGVKMEERSPGSYRISIRGSSLRSPFDVRNVKIYWNGIPFTDPNGITPLNLLDINQMRRVEVVKGPAASIYGAGIGGVINLDTEKAIFGQKTISASAMGGSYNTRRYDASFENGNEYSNYRFVFSRQASEGYRRHTEIDRNTYQLFGEIYSTEKHTLTGNIFYSDLFYEVPGGLTAEQYTEDRRQARPGTSFIPGSEEQNSSVDYQAFLTSIKNHSQWTENFQNTTTIYGMQSYFNMPFLVDYEKETRLGLGGRTSFKLDTRIGNLPLGLMAGGEYQQMFLEGRNFNNEGGSPDSLRFDDEVMARQGMVFLKADLKLSERANLTLGSSLNLLVYDIDRLVGLDEEDIGRVISSFPKVWTPRIGLVYKLLDNMALHGSWGTGFSPPSIKEIRTSDGVLNLGLEPEKGTNYEIGLRGTALNDRLNFDVTAFSFFLNETIVTYTDETFATQKFRNAGSTVQKGLEFLGSFYLIHDPGRWMNLARLNASYAFHHFRFNKYIHLEQDYSGNRLPGVAPNVATVSLDIKTKPGIYGFFSYHFTDKIPLNDDNSVFSSSYQLLDFKVGCQLSSKKTIVDIYAGVNNMLNEKYSLGNDLNPFGGRFYQPAAERNFYIGARVEYKIENK